MLDSIHTDMISVAGQEDLLHILNLQYQAFGRIAEQTNDFNIPPLQESLEDLVEAYQTTLFLKYTLGDRIIGSVRGYLDARQVCHVGKLIVDPESQNCGIGKALILSLEEHFQPLAAKYLLFTSVETPNTLHLYRKLGYAELYRKDVAGMSMIFMEKQAGSTE